MHKTLKFSRHLQKKIRGTYTYIASWGGCGGGGGGGGLSEREDEEEEDDGSVEGGVGGIGGWGGSRDSSRSRRSESPESVALMEVSFCAKTDKSGGIGDGTVVSLPRDMICSMYH